MSTAFHLLCLGIFATTVLLSPACGAMAPSPAQPYSDGLRISQPEYVKTNNSVDTGQAMPQVTLACLVQGSVFIDVPTNIPHLRNKSGGDGST